MVKKVWQTDGRTDRWTDRRMDRLNQSYSCLVTAKKVWRMDRQTDGQTDRGLNHSYSCLVAAKNRNGPQVKKSVCKVISIWNRNMMLNAGSVTKTHWSNHSLGETWGSGSYKFQVFIEEVYLQRWYHKTWLIYKMWVLIFKVQAIILCHICYSVWGLNWHWKEVRKFHSEEKLCRQKMTIVIQNNYN